MLTTLSGSGLLVALPPSSMSNELLIATPPSIHELVEAIPLADSQTPGGARKTNERPAELNWSPLDGEGGN